MVKLEWWAPVVCTILQPGRLAFVEARVRPLFHAKGVLQATFGASGQS
jgi:hypothetical protein